MSRRAWLVMVCISCVLCDFAVADEAPTCEHAKLGTQDATPLAAGTVEVEWSFSLTSARRAFTNKWGTSRRPYLREAEYGLGLAYGVADDLSVSIGLGYADLYDRDTPQLTGSGLTDMELGLKWRFYHNEQKSLEIAYVPALVLPTGKGETSRRLGPSDEFVTIYNGLALSVDWTDRLTSNFDLGYSLPIGGRRGDCRGTLSANAALGYQLTDWLQPEVELNYAHDFMRGADADVLAATAGAIICISENIRLDVGLQQAIAGRNADKSTSFLAALVLSF